MITLQELDRYLDELLECAAYPDLCFNGLQVRGKPAIARLATGVTASVAAIEAAVEWGADALVVHHGLFWDKARVRLVGGVRRRIELLIKNDISLLAYHLPLDAHREVGNNYVAARSLGLSDLQPFGEFRGQLFGVRGKIDPTPVDKWVGRVERYYGQSARTALGGPDLIETVAIVSGGAHRNLSDAVSLGLDCMITGTGDEPQWNQAHEEGIHFLALGHHLTEAIGPRALGKHLRQQLGIETAMMEVANPF